MTFIYAKIKILGNCEQIWILSRIKPYKSTKPQHPLDSAKQPRQSGVR